MQLRHRGGEAQQLPSLGTLTLNPKAPVSMAQEASRPLNTFLKL